MDEKLSPETPPKSSWYHSPLFVIFMLLFVLGPFGLPLLYKSPRFNRSWKIIWTVIMIVYTWSLVVSTIKITQLLLSVIQSSQIV